MKPKDINIGLATRSEITELKRKDLVTDQRLLNFQVMMLCLLNLLL